MIVREMSVDTKSWELAEYFLEDMPHAADDVDRLATLIQDQIETFLQFELPDRVAARARAAEPGA